MDKGRNSIDVFDIEKESFFGTINILTDGSENSLSITDYFVHNLDSIFLFDSARGELAIVNIAGNLFFHKIIRDKFILNCFENGLIAGIDTIAGRMFYHASQNIILFPCIPAMQVTHEDYYKQPFVLLFDVNNMEFTDLVGKYPNDSNIKNTPLTEGISSFSVNDHGDIYFSTALSSTLFRYDFKKDSLLSVYCLKSDQLPNIPNSYNSDFSNYIDQRKYAIENGWYSKHYYHRASQKYIRSS